MKKFLVLALLLFLAGTAMSQFARDTIFFKDGSVIIGKLKKVKLGVVTFDPDNAGDISPQLRVLSGVSATREIFRIETTKGQTFYGKLTPSGDTGYVFLVNTIAKVKIHLQDISVMYPSGDSFLQRFAGNVGLGFNYTKSSDFGRLNFDGSLTYTYKREEISMYAQGIYSITDTAFSRDNETFYLKNNYYFTSTWFGTAFLSYQRNLELGLSRRFQEGLGIGNKFITNKSMYAWARGGWVINQEKSEENVESGTLSEMFLQLEFNFYRFTVPKINLNMTQSFYYNFADQRFRNDGNTKIVWEAVKNFKLTTEFYHNLDSKPPVVGSSKVDYGILFGVSYYFY